MHTIPYVPTVPVTGTSPVSPNLSNEGLSQYNKYNQYKPQPQHIHMNGIEENPDENPYNKISIDELDHPGRMDLINE